MSNFLPSDLFEIIVSFFTGTQFRCYSTTSKAWNKVEIERCCTHPQPHGIINRKRTSRSYYEGHFHGRMIRYCHYQFNPLIRELTISQLTKGVKNVQYITHYFHGKLDGPRLEFGSKGNKKIRMLKEYSEYKDDKLDGLYVSYYNRTNKIKEIYYYEQGVQVGIYKRYYLNKQLRLTFNTESTTNKLPFLMPSQHYMAVREIVDSHEGTPHGINGLRLEYSPQGELIDQSYYKYGTIDGELYVKRNSHIGRAVYSNRNLISEKRTDNHGKTIYLYNTWYGCRHGLQISNGNSGRYFLGLRISSWITLMTVNITIGCVLAGWLGLNIRFILSACAVGLVNRQVINYWFE
jgi:antitoxin component YwqK of YwqJK toxin-antitoxin module